MAAMEGELKRTFTERHNLPGVRKIILDYLTIGHFDVGYYLSKGFRRRIRNHSLPLTCSVWRRYRHSCTNMRGRDPADGFDNVCARQGKRVIFFNFIQTNTVIDCERRIITEASSVHYFDIY